MKQVQKEPQGKKENSSSHKKNDDAYKKASAAMKAKLKNYGFKNGIELSIFFFAV